MKARVCLTSSHKKKSNLRNKNDENCHQLIYKKNDVVMLYNCREKLIHKYYSLNPGREVTPMFKIKTIRSREYILELMQVIYPKPVYQHKNELINILDAINDGNAVVKETGISFNVRVCDIFKIEKPNLMEVQLISELTASSIKYACFPMDTVSGSIICDNPNKGILKYFITKNALYGNSVIGDTVWEYTNTLGSIITDAFQVTIWDNRGAFTTVKVIVSVEREITPFYKDAEVIVEKTPQITYGKMFSITHVLELGGFVENHGTKKIAVYIQCSPNGVNFIDEARVHYVLPGQMIFLTPVYYTPFTRLKFVNDPDEGINVSVWYFIHVSD